MLQMQQFAQSLGLKTFALKTDIETLKGLSDYQVIVYLPQKNHFVVLAEVGAEFIRIIDLDNNRFYYRQSLGCFESAWDGTALIVANEPIELKGQFTRIDDEGLEKIVGAASCSQQCNKSCYSAGESECQSVGGLCGNTHDIYYSRTCCGPATSGSCSEDSKIY